MAVFKTNTILQRVMQNMNNLWFQIWTLLTFCPWLQDNLFGYQQQCFKINCLTAKGKMGVLKMFQKDTILVFKFSHKCGCEWSI